MRGQNETDVKKVYANIVLQAIADLESKNYLVSPELATRLDVYEFFTSKWGNQILTVLGYDFEQIDKKYSLTAKVQEVRDFKERYYVGLSDKEICGEIGITINQARRWRREMESEERRNRREAKRKIV